MTIGMNGMQGVTGAMAPQQVRHAQPKVQAPKIEDPAQSSLLDPEKEKARIERIQEEAQKRVQEETKKQMSAEQHAQSAMGFGSKLQMQLTGQA